jgi:hypothetical protein
MKQIEKLILETYSGLLSEEREIIKPKDLPKAFIDRLTKQFGPVDMEKDFFNQELSQYMKHTGTNKVTGSIGHKVIKLASFSKMYGDMQDIVADIKNLMRSDDIRTDKAARELFELIRTNFRKLQRYLRTERPDQYAIIRQQATLQELFKDFQVHASLINEMDINDPVLMKMRALKTKIGRKRGSGKSGSEKELNPWGKAVLIKKLKLKRDQVMRDMEQEAEPEGGPIADKYGDMLNKIDAALAKASGRKEMDYDTAISKNEEELPHAIIGSDDTFTFGYDLDAIQNVLNHLKSSGYVEGRDYEQHIGYGDDMPNAITLKNPKMEEDTVLGNLLDAASDAGETDYEEYRKQFDDYKEGINESMLDEEEEDEEIPEPEEEPDTDAPEETVLEDATDKILGKFPTVRAAIVKLQTEDFKQFVESIDWISPRPSSFRVNLKNGQDYILKWTGKTFEAQIMGKRYILSNIADYQQALDKLTILYKEAPLKGAGDGEPADIDSGGGGGGGGDFPGEEGGAAGDDPALPDDAGGEEGGADLTDEPIDFEEPGEEPEA